MDYPILSLSERGQLTIPQKIRNQISVKRFVCRLEGSKIILEPIQTREEFFKELGEIEKKCKQRGDGLTLEEIKKKYSL